MTRIKIWNKTKLNGYDFWWEKFKLLSLVASPFILFCGMWGPNCLELVIWSIPEQCKESQSHFFQKCEQSQSLPSFNILILLTSLWNTFSRELERGKSLNHILTKHAKVKTAQVLFLRKRKYAFWAVWHQSLEVEQGGFLPTKQSSSLLTFDRLDRL